MPVRGKPFTKGDVRTGRKPGATNKTTRTIKEVYTEVFESLQDDPQHSLKAWALRKPTEFYKLAGKIIPKQMHRALKFIENINENGL